MWIPVVPFPVFSYRKGSFPWHCICNFFQKISFDGLKLILSTMRKKGLIILLLAGMSTLFSCKQIDKLTQFDLDYSTNVTIKSATIVDLNTPFNFYTPAIKTNSNSELEVNDSRKDLVEQIKVKSLKMKVTSPAGGNFDFLKSIRIYISAEGLEEKMIAWKTDMKDDGSTTITLETADDNLKDYILKDSFQLRTETVTDQLLTQDTDIEIDAVFWVDAKILGV